jgi:DNA repair protein RecN (Recombination protein N)
MLQNLVISNFAIIDNLNINFNEKMTVITGDSGAGKSIILSALSLVLGGRADKSLIKSGQTKSSITASFEDLNNDIKGFLSANDLNENECILRRVITENSSKAFINDTPVSLNLVEKLAIMLVDISSQNSHQLLLKPEHQLKIIDNFSGNNDILQQVKNFASEYIDTTNQILEISNNNNDNTSQLEFLNFQLDELENANLDKEELTTIEERHKLLNNSQNLLENLGQITEILNNSQIDTANSLLNSIVNFDEKLQDANQILESAKINLDEASFEISNYLSSAQISEEEIFNTNQRMVILNDLSRKHNCQIIDLFDKKLEIEEKISAIDNKGQSLENLQNKQKQDLEKYQELSAKLTQSRQSSAEKIAKIVGEITSELGMSGAEIKLDLVKNESVSTNGSESVDFLIKTNSGSDFKSLKKTASGGELSRISLAIAVATSGVNNAPTLVFDEVDVGISGNAATVVGEKIKQLSKKSQVLCITHLPQVASFASNHLLINKIQNENNTSTGAAYLDKNQRIVEIARILSGENVSDKTTALAKEMIETNSIFKKND